MDPDFFYYGFARSGRTALFEKWYGHGRTSRSGCYAPVKCVLKCVCVHVHVHLLS